MSKTKCCKSCDGPLDEFNKKDLIHPDFCPYCVNRKGNVKSYKDIIDMMIDYIKTEHKEIPQAKRLPTAQKWLRKTPVWRKKFVAKDIVIEDIRDENIKDIPQMSRKYDCSSCLYYMQKENKSESVKQKRRWFLSMEKKYGSCGKIFYFQGIPVGFAQYAPKNEFQKLETLKKGSTKTNAWYISCLAIKKKYQGKGLGKTLLHTVLLDLKTRGVIKVYACGQINGDAQDFSSGYWSMYAKEGFCEISSDDGWKVGEKTL